MTGHDVEEAIFFESAGYATAVLGGKAIQCSGGYCVSATGQQLINGF